MDSYKAKFPSLDPAQAGFFTQGESRTLEFTLMVNDVAVDISAADEVQFVAQRQEGGQLVLSSLTLPSLVEILDDGVDPAVLGRVNIDLDSDSSDVILAGRSIPCMVKTFTNGITAIYWGELDEVRESI